MGVLLFGGTFNPIHNGHIKMLNAVSNLEYIKKVLVMPTFIPPHKDAPVLADDFHRLQMCKIACKGIKKAEVSDLEILRGGKSYTFDTVSSLKEIYKGEKIYVACGGDMALTLSSWYRFDELKKLCTFLAINRKGIDEDKFINVVSSYNANGADIKVLDVLVDDISSTYIRSRILNNESIDGLVAEEIADYIYKNRLYNE